MAILAPLCRAERKRMQKLIQKTNDKHFARRLIAMLMLHQGLSVTQVQHITGAARSSIGRWLGWYTQCGIDGLKSEKPGRPTVLPINPILLCLSLLIQLCPEDFGYQRSRWSSELLAKVINAQLKLCVAASTIRRLLPEAGIVWRRSAPTLRIKDPYKAEKMAAINQALEQCSAEHPVFYEDEVDIDLNPKIGADWMPKGQQKRVVTPGNNRKHYLAGALHTKTGKVLYVSSASKASELFIAVLEKLKRHYRKAKTITLILDNYIIHKSRKTLAWLKSNPKFRLLFQPVYSPWVNKIERLWLALHETVTRNHSCRNMRELLGKVWHFMETVSPFPGNGHGIAKM
ncbi:IS630 family transposase ISSen5 [Salmonella enterica subsp. enterica serovar Kentucky]|nr:IS630-like element ISSen5 family transposase [Salmonella enterica]AFL65914.1 transposase [Salmonella enterica subsp. enterica serovar Kentucky]CAH2871570.1 IS630 family transposase ISSen5 [Salmonella enterica subsp. enterica serovar Kentucky]